MRSGARIQSAPADSPAQDGNGARRARHARAHAALAARSPGSGPPGVPDHHVGADAPVRGRAGLGRLPPRSLPARLLQAGSAARVGASSLQPRSDFCASPPPPPRPLRRQPVWPGHPRRARASLQAGATGGATGRSSCAPPARRPYRRPQAGPPPASPPPPLPTRGAPRRPRRGPSSPRRDYLGTGLLRPAWRFVRHLALRPSCGGDGGGSTGESSAERVDPGPARQWTPSPGGAVERRGRGGASCVT